MIAVIAIGFRSTRRACITALVLALGVGCSSDAIQAPEPTVTTPGAFVAIGPNDTDLQLYRVVEALSLSSGETLVFVIIYEGHPKSYEAARELAQQPNLPTLIPITALALSELIQNSWKVVWFRSLTQEEIALVR
jgi:hypothetical protein